MIKKTEFLPTMIQMRIDAKERLDKARVLAEREKCVNDIMGGFYSGKATDQSRNHNRTEINSYMELP